MLNNIISAIKHEFSNSEIAIVSSDRENAPAPWFPKIAGLKLNQDPEAGLMLIKKDNNNSVSLQGGRTQWIEMGKQLRGLDILSKLQHLGLIFASIFRIPFIGRIADAILAEQGKDFFTSPTARPDVREVDNFDLSRLDTMTDLERDSLTNEPGFTDMEKGLFVDIKL